MVGIYIYPIAIKNIYCRSKKVIYDEYRKKG